MSEITLLDQTEQNLQNNSAVRLVIAMGRVLGHPPLTVEEMQSIADRQIAVDHPPMERVQQLLLNSNTMVKDKVVIDAFSGDGIRMHLALMHMNAHRVVHIDIRDLTNSFRLGTGGYAQDFIVADLAGDQEHVYRQLVEREITVIDILMLVRPIHDPTAFFGLFKLIELLMAPGSRVIVQTDIQDTYLIEEIAEQFGFSIVYDNREQGGLVFEKKLRATRKL